VTRADLGADRLPCGASVDSLLEQVADGAPRSDPQHQRDCPHCRAAVPEVARVVGAGAHPGRRRQSRTAGLSFSLPYFRNRRYLTGIDWVVGALHEAGKKSIGNGAISQAILEIDGRLEDQPLRAALEQISRRFPLIHGHFARDWFNLAPYWKISAAALNASIPLQVVDLPSGASAQADQLLVEHVNSPLEHDSQHLRFLLVRIGNEQSRLGLLFDHRLFDAYGVEAFFRLVDETAQGRLEEIAPQVKVTEPAHLDHWLRRLASGKALNRLLVQLQQRDVRALAMPQLTGHRERRQIRFVHESLTVEQTTRINQKAFEEISGTDPAAFGCGARGRCHAADHSAIAPARRAVFALHLRQHARPRGGMGLDFLQPFFIRVFRRSLRRKKIH